jgi:hypothetical protein
LNEIPPAGLPWENFRSTGLLWLVNRAVFHPRGFALAMHFDDAGHCTGWSVLGDGHEPWRYEMDAEENGCFRAAEATFSVLRNFPGTAL